MFWLAIIMFVVGVVLIGAAANAPHHDEWAGWVVLIGLILIVLSAWQTYTAIYNRGVIAHASGQVTATRIDHGDRIEWKIEAKEARNEQR